MGPRRLTASRRRGPEDSALGRENAPQSPRRRPRWGCQIRPRGSAPANLRSSGRPLQALVVSLAWLLACPSSLLTQTTLARPLSLRRLNPSEGLFRGLADILGLEGRSGQSRQRRVRRACLRSDLAQRFGGVAA